MTPSILRFGKSGIMKTANPVYDFFRPELRDESYAIGDVYSTEEVIKAQEQWDILSNPEQTKYPYLEHVKLLSGTWPHLRLLADFMEVSTTPLRWKDLSTSHPTPGADLDPEEKKKRTRDRDERASRTNVTVLRYLASGEVKETPCKKTAELVAVLDEGNTEEKKKEGESEDEGVSGGGGALDECKLRLYVVEDLSRDVIEALGSKLDIEPAFFREHIVDYAWCNIRDRWQDPPNLRVAEGHRRWVQVRYVTARYYKTAKEFKEGVKEAEKFNVLRRPDDDVNNKAVWDDRDAISGITRSRASFWLKKGEDGKEDVGVLLLDPTIQKGTPLWYGYRNWEPTPSITKPVTPGPHRKSFFEDFIYWAKKTPSSQVINPSPTSTANTHMPMQTLLYLICSEWLTISDYIRTRIGIIEWEISNPDHFLSKDFGIDDALKKLHVWRRLVPLYREMLTDSLQRVFRTPVHDTSTTVTINNTSTPLSPLPPSLAPTSTHPIQSDFSRALSYMEEYQQRIDRLTSVVTAIISIEDSRRSQDDNRNVARLTWLATFFIPLSYIASLFSMQEDLSTLGRTMRVYFATAVPVAAFAMGLAWVLTLPWVLGIVRGLQGKKGARKG
ncbi:hypothetical protein BKA65DRAFT_431202 [Rhexocercosporidium sp. MPI-PUGE-AT-0058]|nr:hypothetical protein BKA65DRAFT_431202 [Rhexocercosporidium sp. MPI-PUGE-AT-0058]